MWISSQQTQHLNKLGGWNLSPEVSRADYISTFSVQGAREDCSTKCLELKEQVKTQSYTKLIPKHPHTYLDFLVHFYNIQQSYGEIELIHVHKSPLDETLELLDEIFVGGGFFFWKMFILDNQKNLREN